jgi:hypothetical protein
MACGAAPPDALVPSADADSADVVVNGVSARHTVKNLALKLALEVRFDAEELSAKMLDLNRQRIPSRRVGRHRLVDDCVCVRRLLADALDGSL